MDKCFKKPDDREDVGTEEDHTDMDQEMVDLNDSIDALSVSDFSDISSTPSCLLPSNRFRDNDIRRIRKDGLKAMDLYRIRKSRCKRDLTQEFAATPPVSNGYTATTPTEGWHKKIKLSPDITTIGSVQVIEGTLYKKNGHTLLIYNRETQSQNSFDTSSRTNLETPGVTTASYATASTIRPLSTKTENPSVQEQSYPDRAEHRPKTDTNYKNFKKTSKFVCVTGFPAGILIHQVTDALADAGICPINIERQGYGFICEFTDTFKSKRAVTKNDTLSDSHGINVAFYDPSIKKEFLQDDNDGYLPLCENHAENSSLGSISDTDQNINDSREKSQKNKAIIKYQDDFSPNSSSSSSTDSDTISSAHEPDSDYNMSSCSDSESISGSDADSYTVSDAVSAPDSYIVSDIVKSPPKVTWHESSHYTCEYCSSQFTNSTTLRRHIKLKRCPVLHGHLMSDTKRKKLLSNIETRMNRANQKPPKTPYHTCEYCSSQFTSSTSLRRHIKLKRCPVLHGHLMSDAKRKSLLKIIETRMNRANMTNKSKDYPSKTSKYGCRYCGFQFASKDNLRRHIKTEKCPVLHGHLMSDAKRKKLLNFQETRRSRANQKQSKTPYYNTCEYCSSQFTTSTTLRRHIKRESCPVLHGHLMSDTKRKSLLTNIETRMSRANMTNKSKDYPSKTFPYVCRYCGFPFSIRNNLWSHIKLKCCTVLHGHLMSDAKRKKLLRNQDARLSRANMTNKSKYYPSKTSKYGCRYCVFPFTTKGSLRSHIKLKRCPVLHGHLMSTLRRKSYQSRYAESITRRTQIPKTIDIFDADENGQFKDIPTKKPYSYNMENGELICGRDLDGIECLFSVNGNLNQETKEHSTLHETFNRWLDENSTYFDIDDDNKIYSRPLETRDFLNHKASWCIYVPVAEETVLLYCGITGCTLLAAAEHERDGTRCKIHHRLSNDIKIRHSQFDITKAFYSGIISRKEISYRLKFLKRFVVSGYGHHIDQDFVRDFATMKDVEKFVSILKNCEDFSTETQTNILKNSEVIFNLFSNVKYRGTENSKFRLKICSK